MAIASSFVIILLVVTTMTYQYRPREAAKLIMCKSNLKQIWHCLQEYADDNNGFLPPKPGAAGLKKLLKYAKNPQLFICPSSKGYIPAKKGTPLTEINVSYYYPGEVLHIDDAANKIICRDKAHNHKLSGFVLYGNGRIAKLKDADWLRMAK